MHKFILESIQSFEYHVDFMLFFAHDKFNDYLGLCVQNSYVSLILGELIFIDFYRMHEWHT